MWSLCFYGCLMYFNKNHSRTLVILDQFINHITRTIDLDTSLMPMIFHIQSKSHPT